MTSYSRCNEENDARIGVLYRLHSCIVDVTSYRLSNHPAVPPPSFSPPSPRLPPPPSTPSLPTTPPPCSIL